MSYAKHYKSTDLYRQRPDIVEMLIDMKPGDLKKIFLTSREEASKLRYKLYGFQQSFYGMARFVLTVDPGRNDGDIRWAVGVMYPLLEGDLK